MQDLFNRTGLAKSTLVTVLNILANLKLIEHGPNGYQNIFRSTPEKSAPAEKMEPLFSRTNATREQLMQSALTRYKANGCLCCSEIIHGELNPVLRLKHSGEWIIWNQVCFDVLRSIPGVYENIVATYIYEEEEPPPTIIIDKELLELINFFSPITVSELIRSTNIPADEVSIRVLQLLTKNKNGLNGSTLVDPGNH